MYLLLMFSVFFFFQAEDGIRDLTVTGVQTCALPISQLGKTEARQLVGNNQVARQRQLEPAAETHTVDSRDGCEWRHIDPVEHGVNALQEFAHTLWCGRRIRLLNERVQFPQIGASGKS